MALISPTGLLGTYLGNVRGGKSLPKKVGKAITGLPSLLGGVLSDPRFQDSMQSLAMSEQRIPADDLYYRAKAREENQAARLARAAANNQASFVQPLLNRNAAIRQGYLDRQPFNQRTAAQETAAVRGLLPTELNTELSPSAFRSVMPPIAQPRPGTQGLLTNPLTRQEIALTSGVPQGPRGTVEPLAHQTPQHLTHVGGMLPGEEVAPRMSQAEWLAHSPKRQAILAGLTSPDEVTVRQSMKALSELPADISTTGQKLAWSQGYHPDDSKFAQIAQSIDAPVKPYESTAERLEAEDYDTLYKNIRDGLGKTREAVKQLEQIDDIFSKTYTGPGGEALNAFRRIASVFFPGDDFLEGKVTAADAAVALGNKLTLQMRNTGEGAGMPGQMSDKDRDFLARMVPNLSMTPGGRKILIKVYKKMRDLYEERFERASAYKAKHRSLDAGFDRQENEIQKQLQASGRHIFQTDDGVHFADEAEAENIPKNERTASGVVTQNLFEDGDAAFRNATRR
jgi:hypothetical protein